MDYKMFAVALFAIAGSYLIFSMPLAFATDVSIYYNSQLRGSSQISPQNIVNKQVVISHLESDVTWSNTKVLVRVSTASMAHSIKRIYLYKCKKLDPNACMQTIPQSFDNWVDTELAWSDISEQQGQSSYPQVANILVLVKLEGINSRVSWMAFWDTVKRIDYNVFNEYSREISSIDVYAKSADLVSPIQSYIGNFQMVPFNWVSKVVFSSASVLYGGKGNTLDLSKPQPDLETIQTVDNQISTMNKDFGFIFSNISSGVTNALTMNLNPSFTCGDNKCDTDLGESMDSCCFDCDCTAGSYCDITSGTQGGCKVTNDTTLSVLGYTVPTPLQQCSSQTVVNVTAKIDNPPSSMPANINGLFRINGTQYPVSCAGSGGTYICQLRVQPPVSCGFGSFSLGPNTLNMSISYRDGANTVFNDLSTPFPNINVNYDCGCQANFYCDVGPNICRSEGSIMLQVLSVDSYLNNFTGANDMVKSVLRIVNTPTNFTVNSFTFNFGNITWETNSVPASSPTVNCINAGVAGNSHTYNCSPTLTIPNYNPNNSYVVRANSVNASITYTDGGIQKQNVLRATFGDIIIPQQSCGNGRVDPRETQANCCRDAGCPSVGQWCDVQNGCQYTGNISATVLNVDPTNVSDCIIPHIVNLTVRINNAPSDARLNYFSYLRNGLVQAWPMQCSQPAYMTGIVNCFMTMPPQSNCTMPFSRIDGNSINMSISFRNGDRESLVREMNAQFGDLIVTPAWHCGDRSCESAIGESAANCCIDCTCSSSTLFGNNSADYYCNYDPQNIANGSCESRSRITLVIDRPTAPVRFKSCEYNNFINIKAHVVNQPASMKLENFFGTFNGQSAEIMCEQGGILPSASYIGGWSCVGTTYSGAWSCIGVNCSQYTSQANCVNIAGCSWSQSSAASSCSQYTDQSSCTSNSGCRWQPAANLLTAFNINCTMLVPPEGECSQGITYSYTNNSIGVFVSFRDGIGKVVTQTLISSIADASTTQSYRSLYEITQDAVEKMQDNVQKSLDLMKKLMDWIKICITMSIVLAIVEVGATVLVAARAGEGEHFMDRVGTERWKNSVAAVGAASTAINTIWGNICNLIQLYYQAAQKNIEIEAEMLKMDVCIQVYQHMLDSGRCVTMGLDSCFSGLRSCVNYGAISSAMSGMNSVMGQASAATMNIGNAITQWGTAMGTLSGAGGNVILRLVWNNNMPFIDNDKVCNRWSNELTAPTNVDKKDILRVQVLAGTDCKYVVVDYVANNQTKAGKLMGQQLVGSSEYPLDLDAIQTETTWYFNAYCFESQNDYLQKTGTSNADRDKNIANAKKTSDVKITVLIDPTDSCGVGGSGVSGATSTIISTITSAETSIGQITDTAFIQNTKLAVLGQLSNARNAVTTGQLQQAKTIIGTSTPSKTGVIGVLLNAKTNMDSINQGRIDTAVDWLNTAISQIINSGTSGTGGSTGQYYMCATISGTTINSITCKLNSCNTGETKSITGFNTMAECNNAISESSNTASGFEIT